MIYVPGSGLPRFLHMITKAVFLDKDGTLVENIPYNANPDLIRLEAGALEALSQLQGQGYQLIVVSNQSGLARGYFKEKDLKRLEQRLKEMLSAAGICLAGFYYCPHHPEGEIKKFAVECFCRKPQPGMLYQAALEHPLDLKNSWMVGDNLDDMEAGNRAGCRTVLIDNNPETQWDLKPIRHPTFRAKDLKAAADVIIKQGVSEWNGNDEQKPQFAKYY